MIDFFWLLLGLAVLTVLLHLLARLLYVPITSRTFQGAGWLPARWQEPLGEGETVRFTARDGARLEGSYLRTTAPARFGIVVYCHELNGDRWNALPYMAGLRDRGFDVFTFDFRNHGDSDRVSGYEPTPWVTTYETADVQAAIDYVCSRPDTDSRGVGLLGVSKGAAVALCTAAEEPRVQTLVLDGVYAPEQFKARMRLFLAKPRLPAVRWVGTALDLCVEAAAVWGRLVIGWRRNCRFVNVEQAARRVRRPMLVIHGECDSDVPVELAEGLLDSMSAEVEFWSVPRARHNGAIDVAPAEYHQRVAQFLREHLGGLPLPTSVAPRLDRPVATPVGPAGGKTPVAVSLG